MAVTFMTGFEAQNASADGITITGTASNSSTQARTLVCGYKSLPPLRSVCCLVA
jgi:hypothetical protein